MFIFEVYSAEVPSCGPHLHNKPGIAFKRQSQGLNSLPCKGLQPCFQDQTWLPGQCWGLGPKVLIGFLRDSLGSHLQDWASHPSHSTKYNDPQRDRRNGFLF